MADESELLAHIHRQRAQDLKARIWLGDVQLGHLDLDAPQRMLDHLQAAASAGDVEAFAELGDAYADGVGFQHEVKVDEDRAFAAYEAGAERGSARAARRYLRLALLRRPGPEGASRLGQWIEWLLGNDPHGEASWIAGVAARRGYGLPQDPVRAARWLEAAAKRGHAEAMWELAELHANDPPRDPDAARRWRLAAAQAGHVEGAYALAQSLARGTDGPADLVRAIEWYERAAHEGHAQARLALGILYLTGQGVTADPVAASAWFDEAAEAGLDVDEALMARNLSRPR